LTAGQAQLCSKTHNVIRVIKAGKRVKVNSNLFGALGMKINGCILNASLSWIRKKSNSSDAKNFSSVFIFFFLHLKPDFRY